MLRLHRGLLVTLPIAALVHAACGGSSQQNGDSSNFAMSSGNGGTSSAAAGINGVNAANGTNSTGALVGSGAGTGVGVGNGSSGVGGGCATSSSEATLVPLNLFIMFDDSGSMKQNNKWVDAQASLTAFFQDPASAGIGVALRFFPQGTCDNNNCDVAACQQPLVPLGTLTADPAPMDMQEQALVSSVQGTSPNNGGGTPLSAALQGAENWAVAYQEANPAQKTVVVLVTDGQPNGCDENVTDIANIAAMGLAAAKVPTYAVGLQGSAQSTMDQIAMAGGTMQAIFIDAGTQAQMELLQALKSIQGQQVACAFAMPMPMNGQTIDPSLVNVSYTPGNGGMPQELTQVMNASACTASGGWYYDNPTTPTTVTLCPTTCMQVQADTMAKIELVFGCKTKVN